MPSSIQEHNLSILVADDDRRMRESLRDLLNVYGMQCSLVEDGQQALDLMDKQNIDLVLLDIQMPKRDGMQVLKHIHKQFPETDVIILSGEASFENARSALRMGALDFLNKPYNPAELLSLINSLSDKRNRDDKGYNKNISSISDVEKTLVELEEIIEKEDKALTHTIVNASPAVAFLWKNEINWPVQFVSENVTKLFGYSANEFITGKVRYKSIIHPDDVERFSDEVPHDEQTIKFKHKPYRVITKSGVVKWIDDSSSIVRDEKKDITHFQGILIDVTEREMSRQKMLKNQVSLEHIAHHDALTGLPNRLLLWDRLKQSIKKIKRVKKQLALLYIDLDKFKEINDSLGHNAGDEVLKIIARRLLDNVRLVDTVARIGGDEFVVLIDSVAGMEDVKIIAEKLNYSLQQPVYWKMHELFVTSSIGISLSSNSTEDPDEIIKKADIAMYQSKKIGRNTYQFYHSR